MKVHLIISCLITFASMGQLSLTSVNFPVAGETYVFSTANDPSIDFATTGAGQTWDFSALISSGQRIDTLNSMSLAAPFSQFMFGAFAPTPYKANYFQSTVDFPIEQITSVLPVTINDISLFTKNSSAEITSVGYEFLINGQGIAVRSDTIEKRYVLPLNFGNAYNSTGYTKLNLNPIYDGEWRQLRDRSSEVDGWGTIVTPAGTYNALRIHHVIDEVDSIYVTGFGAGIWVPLTLPKTHEYEWRTNTDKEAVLRIRTSENFGTETVSSIEYRDTWLGLNDIEVDVEFGPNPATDFLNISSKEQIISVQVISSNGQFLSKTFVNNTSTSLNLTELNTGNYFLVVQTSKGFGTKTFVKN